MVRSNYSLVLPKVFSTYLLLPMDLYCAHDPTHTGIITENPIHPDAK